MHGTNQDSKLTETPAEFLFSKNLWELFARASEPAQFAGRAPRPAGHSGWQESVGRADGLPLPDPRWARLAGPDPWELECDLRGLGYRCSRSKTELTRTVQVAGVEGHQFDIYNKYIYRLS